MGKVYNSELVIGESSVALGVSASAGPTGHKIVFDALTPLSNVVTLSAVHTYSSNVYDSEVNFGSSSATLGVSGLQGAATSKLAFNAATLAGSVTALSASHAGTTYEFQVDLAYHNATFVLVDVNNLSTTFIVNTGAMASVITGGLVLNYGETVYTFSVDEVYHGSTFAIIDENRLSTEFTVSTSTDNVPISGGSYGTNALSQTVQRLWAMGMI